MGGWEEVGKDAGEGNMQGRTYQREGEGDGEGCGPTCYFLTSNHDSIVHLKVADKKLGTTCHYVVPGYMYRISSLSGDQR